MSPWERYPQIIRDGLWSNNQALVALLGLCPLLAVSNTAVNGLGLGIATTAILTLSNVTVSLIRNLVRPEVRLPVFVLVIASFVTMVELVMNAYFHELYRILGIFVPLIVTNCAIIGRAEAFASKNPVDQAFLDGLATGIGFASVLVLLGAMRELVGQGTVLAQADLLFGREAETLTLQVLGKGQGLLLAILPPGAFFGLGLLLAAKNAIDARFEKRPKGSHCPAERQRRRDTPAETARASDHGTIFGDTLHRTHEPR
jgi:electron transport complex protein RnfE